jgi:hypothetical protein
MRSLTALLVCGLFLGCAAGKERSPLPMPAPGTGGSSGTGGSAPTGGAVGTGGSTTPDAAAPVVTPDAPVAAPDAPLSTPADAGAAPTDAVVVTDGRYWLQWCQADWPKAQCCAFYCSCMQTTCPGTLPASCQTACEGGNWNLKCRVEQCFEARNPNVPQDKGSHCGHAVEKPPKCQGLTP